MDRYPHKMERLPSPAEKPVGPISERELERTCVDYRHYPIDKMVRISANFQFSACEAREGDQHRGPRRENAASASSSFNTRDRIDHLYQDPHRYDREDLRLELH